MGERDDGIWNALGRLVELGESYGVDVVDSDGKYLVA